MSRARLPKEKVIKKAIVFNDIFEKGNKRNSKNMFVMMLDSPTFAIGFAVSTKIRGAVKRNRAKRLLREVFRLNQESLPTKKMMVLVAKPGILRAEFGALQKEFKLLMEA